MAIAVPSRLCLVGLVLFGSTIWSAPLTVTLKVEETIDTVASAQNGASPLWCFGSHIMVRDRDTLYLSLLRPDVGSEPFCNAHWELWQRTGEGWLELHRGGAALEREPCPIGLLGEADLVISIQPRIVAKPFNDGGNTSWFCQPGLLGIDPLERRENDRVYTNLLPVFPVGSVFSQHSYRGLGVDRANGEILLMVMEQTDEHYQPTWLSRDGRWHPLPLLEFPIRACYPQVALNDRAAHVLAIGDIVEPVEAWRQAKYEASGRKWDYAFRRLFYTWSPDLETAGFADPIEIDSVDDTAGNIRNLDLHVDAAGRAHILYLKQPHQHTVIRDRFFPGEPMTGSLEYALVEQGQVVARQSLHRGTAEEDSTNWGDSVKLSFGRFHPLPGGDLAVVYSGSWSDGDGEVESGLFLSALSEEGSVEQAIRLPAERPFTGTFFTNTPRGGSDVGSRLDLIGAFNNGGSLEMRYLGYEVIE